ncbi:hypothetical protein RF679_18520 [Undibacterium cyanobacteriorum]|uniref:Uncharacterized protein n=1 Tax=Undibacterium cyanobacteriorum TaxID=3073561 RepID=A0ABY9RI21_9BURK|nr:hypothetical protein [Undibacterium sp. 20NA77.5]WMW80611.1 hypothetical protein RF679_18520 [Undibacterium sp. 20NA77.5]
MKKFSKHWHLLCGLLAIGLSPIASHAADNKSCPYTEAYLSEQLGVTVKVVTQMPGLLGPACEYADAKRSLKIAVDAGRNPAPSADAWRKMANPPGTKWKTVAGDADKAVLLEASPNMELHPSLSYERKGWLVQINVMGIQANEVSKWNEKLLKLKRLPE